MGEFWVAIGWDTLNWLCWGSVVGSICISCLDRWKLWKWEGAQERRANFLVYLLEGWCQISQKARQVVIGFIQGQLYDWMIDLLEPVDHQGGFAESGWRGDQCEFLIQPGV
jgi:hypothetical protein